MKQILALSLSVICLFFTAKVKAQETTDKKKSFACLFLQNGKFKCTPKGDTIPVIVERKNGIQTEVTKERTAIFKIKWTSDCTYILTLTESNAPEDQKLMNLPLEVTMTPMNKDKYTYTCAIEGSDRFVTGEMERIK